MKQVVALRPETYQAHAIHQPGRIWAETNCYTDLWIELLHGLGREPIASLAFTLAIDFEGDQWTFFKPMGADLYELYGIDLQELAIWRELALHIEEQVGNGRPVLAEVDAFHLPDTAGTSYREHHTKTTVGVVEIDLARGRMGYFHNQGYYQVGGEDFRALLQAGVPVERAGLPPYVEFAKIPGHSPTEATLREIALRQMRAHLRRAPAENPFPRFEAALTRDLGWLLRGSLDDFHRYSFATLRQYGACFELAQTFLQWLAEGGEPGLEAPMKAFQGIAQGAKVFQFQLARAVSRRGTMDLSPLAAMAASWADALGRLRSRYA